MLDWYTIEYLYPSSVERFSKVMFPNLGLVSLSLLNVLDMKRLYYFFDKQGIYLTVEMLSKDSWLYSVSLENGNSYAPCQISKSTREEIEIEGFHECFRLLEKKLRLNTY